MWEEPEKKKRQWRIGDGVRRMRWDRDDNYAKRYNAKHVTNYKKWTMKNQRS